MRALANSLLVLLSLAALSCRNESVPELKLASGNRDVKQVAGIPTSFADVANMVEPAVVTIHSERRVRAPQQHPFMDIPELREFFPSPQQREFRQRGLGSGVIVTPDGYLLTNHHVIDGAQEIKVEMRNGKVFDAKLVGSDPPSDLAVLRIAGSEHASLALANSDQVQVGDVVLAVGNPLGVGQTVTMGIISAKSRSTGLSDGSFEDFLQTDAPINQGNSGGALVNSSGNLIGINSQIVSPTGGNIGIGFAIPSNMARSVFEQIVRNGRVVRGQLGIGVQEVTTEIAESVGLKEIKGVIVTNVLQGSAADRAGIRAGDVVLALNNSPISDPNNLRNRVASTEPGTEVTITIFRDNREQSVRAKIDAFTPGRRAPE